MIRNKFSAAVLLLFTIFLGQAVAHHGFEGRYSLAAPVWIEGDVLEAYFGYPHSELIIAVPNDITLPSSGTAPGLAESFLNTAALVIPDDLPGQIVTLELPPTAQYASLSDRITPGEKIATIALRNCKPPHQFNVQWLRLSNGDIESRAATMSYMVAEC